MTITTRALASELRHEAGEFARVEIRSRDADTVIYQIKCQLCRSPRWSIKGERDYVLPIWRAHHRAAHAHGAEVSTT